MLRPEIAETDDALGLINRKEVLYAVAKGFRNRTGISAEPLHHVVVLPGAAFVDRPREIPVIERDKGADVVLQQAVHQIGVETQAFGVDIPCAVGDDAGPADGEAIVAHAHLLHERDILAEAMIVVAGDVACAVIGDETFPVMGEVVPDGGAFAALRPAALNLVGCGCGTPEKILREMHDECSFQRIISI